jgi:hypothetical protein
MDSSDFDTALNRHGMEWQPAGAGGIAIVMLRRCEGQGHPPALAGTHWPHMGAAIEAARKAGLL